MTELTVAPPPAWPRRRVIGWAAFTIVMIGVALLIRYEIIQPHEMGIACSSATPPSWCGAREALVFMHTYGLWGWIALVASLAAFFLHWNFVLKVGFAFSILALVLYNADFGSFGLVLSLLRLARS